MAASVEEVVRRPNRLLAVCDVRAADVAACTGQPPDAGTASSAASSPSSVTALRTDLPVLGLDELPFAAPHDEELPAGQRAALQAVLDAAVTRPGNPILGLTAAVVSPAGSWAGAAGVDGAVAPLVPDSTFDIASVTKTVTAAEVVSLAQAGRIDLDEPASKYLTHPLLQRNPTVRQLLSHTSGVPDFLSPAFDADAAADPARSFTPGEALAYASDPLADPGGPAFRYSNSNYLLLGLLIEKITGLPYGQAVQRDVLGELGSRMVAQDPMTPTGPLAVPDQREGVVPPGWFLPSRAWASAGGAAGGIAADAPTLANWGYRLYGGQVLPAERTVELTTDVTYGYGLGTMIMERRNDLREGAVGHNGRMPGYTTLLVVFPAHQLSVAVLIVGNGRPDDVALDIFTAMSA